MKRDVPDRREFLKQTLALSATALLAPSLAWSNELSLTNPLPPWESLARALKGRLILPSQPADYDAARIGYQARFNIRPQAIVQPETLSDIIESLNWTDRYNLPIFLKSGGHSYEALSRGAGVVFDFKKFNQTVISPPAQRAWLGTGLKLGDVNDALFQKGMMIPTGSCSTVGLAGLTLGGGYGLSSRYLGLTADQVVEFQMVTAAGQIVTANAANNSDLFWALRGAGPGQLGIVTAFKFQLTPVRPVTVFNFRWSPSQWRDVFKVWQDWAPHAPKELTSLFTLGIQAGKFTLARVSGLYWGMPSGLKELLKVFDSVGVPLTQEIKTMNYLESTRYFAGGTPPAQAYFKAKSDYVYKPWSDGDCVSFEKAVANSGLPGGALLFDSYGGQIAAKSRQDSAFVHRDPLYSIQYFSQWSNPASTPIYMAAMKKLYNDVRSLVSGEAYLNYCDLDLQSPLHAYYAENLPRLQSIKQAWDPKNRFRHGQSLKI